MKVAFICLANSRKHGGRCVAGIRTDGGGWIRPVSRGSSGTLSRGHYTLDNRSEAGLLDVIEVEVSAPRAEPHQPENWVLGREHWGFIDWILGTPQWRLIERIEVAKALPSLEQFTSHGPDLLCGQEGRVSYTDLNNSPAPASLALIEPSNVSFIVAESSKGRIQTRAGFQFGGKHYALPLTDPKWERILSNSTLGIHRPESAGVTPQQRLFFTISLGEPFNGECFKLVAAVIVLPASDEAVAGSAR